MQVIKTLPKNQAPCRNVTRARAADATRITQVIDDLQRQDRRLLVAMAAEAEASPEAMLVALACEYLNLRRHIPEALPAPQWRHLGHTSKKPGAAR